MTLPQSRDVHVLYMRARARALGLFPCPGVVLTHVPVNVGGHKMTFTTAYICPTQSGSPFLCSFQSSGY